MLGWGDAAVSATSIRSVLAELGAAEMDKIGVAIMPCQSAARQSPFVIPLRLHIFTGTITPPHPEPSGVISMLPAGCLCFLARYPRPM